jgi:hypothetical protein
MLCGHPVLFRRGLLRRSGSASRVLAPIRRLFAVVVKAPAGWIQGYNGTRRRSSKRDGRSAIWKRSGSGKPQQSAADMCAPSLAERPERQTAVDRSSRSRLTSRRSPVRAGHRPSSRVRFRGGKPEVAPMDEHVSTGRVEALWKRGAPRRRAAGVSAPHDGVPSRPASPPMGRPPSRILRPLLRSLKRDSSLG